VARSAVLKIDVIVDEKGAVRGVNATEQKMGGLGRTAGRVGKAVAVGLGAIGVAAGAMAVASVKSASAVEQSTGAVESIYGRAAASVKRYAADAAVNLGLAKSEYQDLAAVIGAQLTNMGRSQREAAKESNNLITMGADLAATFGGSVSDAVSAVSSLLKGERDPIEKYGVSIKQSDVNARLAAQGLGDLTGKALAQAQATATLDLLTQQTTKSHGAFGRESNTLAGQQERLKAQFENVKATVGGALTPALTTLFAWVSTKVLPGARTLAATLSANLGPAIRQVGAFITGTAVPAARSLFTWYMEKIAPGIRSALTPILAGLRSAFARVTSTVSDNREGLTKIGNTIRTVAEFIARYVVPVIGTVLGGAFRSLGIIISGTIRTISAIATAIDRVIGKIRDLASAVRNSPIGKLGGAIGGLFAAPTPVGMRAPRFAGIAPLAGDGRGLARASFSRAALGSGSFDTPRGAAMLTVVDRRTIDARVYVDGDVIDAPAFADRLQRAQTDQAVRLGKATAFGGGR
jgi:hypothetical protein